MTKTQNSSTQSDIARNNKNPPTERRYRKNREQSHILFIYFIYIGISLTWIEWKREVKRK
jgi:hypothetical protein